MSLTLKENAKQIIGRGSQYLCLLAEPTSNQSTGG